jgi:hypothetical protein
MSKQQSSAVSGRIVHPPEHYVTPFRARGASIVDANDMHVAEVSALYSRDDRSRMVAWIVQAMNAEPQGSAGSGEEWNPADEQVRSAATWYRHDLGLLTVAEAAKVKTEARLWLRAWQKEVAALRTEPQASADREGFDKEDFADDGAYLARFSTATTEPQSSSMASDDPTASKEWNDGCDFAMTQLCKFLDVEPSSVSWDAATETVEGDVSAVIGNILRAKFGEDWGPQCQAESAK